MAFRDCNLLVVDPDSQVRQTLRRLIDGLGVGIVEADSADAALDAVASEDWLMVVLGVDPQQPRSFELARGLRSVERCRRTPMLFVTPADIQHEDLRYAFALGALDVLRLAREDEDLVRQHLVTYVELFRQQAELEHLLNMMQAENRALYDENERYRKEQSDMLRRASQDALTGLPNRLLFEDRVDAAILRANRNRRRFALMFADVDGMKKINDRCGHLAGDALLTAVGRRMAEGLRASDTVARLGGDEFGILLEDVVDGNVARQVADKLLTQVGQTLLVECAGEGPDLALQPALSIGIALFPDHGLLREELLMLADLAMYRVKRAGGNAVAVYDLGN